MACDRCGSERILDIDAKCSDMCSTEFGGVQDCDYAPYDVGIGGGDYVTFDLCLECGKVQGEFPVEDPSFATPEEEDDWDEDEYEKWNEPDDWE